MKYIINNKTLTIHSYKYIENWYEDRLGLVQEYKKDPELRMVSFYKDDKKYI
jgi:hypothetical protein